MKKLTIAIDIDGTIRPEVSAFKKFLQEPLEGVREAIEKLYNQGHHIIFFTACGWVEYDLTLEWLNQHGFMFHQLICGKPVYDIVVDDRSLKSVTELATTLFNKAVSPPFDPSTTLIK